MSRPQSTPNITENSTADGPKWPNSLLLARSSLPPLLQAVSTYKGHIIRDTFLRLVQFLGEIRDRLVLGNKFTVTMEIFTKKLPY